MLIALRAIPEVVVSGPKFVVSMAFSVTGPGFIQALASVDGHRTNCIEKSLQHRPVLGELLANVLDPIIYDGSSVANGGHNS